MPTTEAETINADLLAFLKARGAECRGLGPGTIAIPCHG